MGTADASSATVTVTGVPLTPPARFISSTASCTGWVNDDAIVETGPVRGASSPIANAPSTAGRVVVVVVDAGRAAEDPLPLSHAATPRIRTTSSAPTPRARVACPVVAGAMARGYRRHVTGGRVQIPRANVPTTPRSATSARDGGIVTNRHLRRTAVGAVLAAALVVAPLTAGAWPGDPDGAFGSCGVRRVDAVAGAPSALRAAAGASDGKVLAAGSANGGGLVMRLAGGAPDATFGSGGWTRVGYGTADARYDAVDATAASGAVAVGRRTTTGGTDSVIAVFTPSGKLSTSFHSSGRLTFNAGGDDGATAVAVAGDGSVFVGGNAVSGGYVAHYTAAGTPDSGWDGDGRRSGLAMSVSSIALRPDGSVLVGGATGAAPSDGKILRLASNGSTDSGFGGPAGVTVDAGGHDAFTAIALQADGKVVATGFGIGAAGHGQTIVRRYLADGGADPGFTPYHAAFGIQDAPVGIVAQSSGATVVAANSKVGNDNDVVLVRLTADGTPDEDFGIDGATVSDAGRRPLARGVVAPSAGRPLLVGSTRVGSRDVASVFRFQGDGSAGPLPTEGFVLDVYGRLSGWSAGCLGAPAAVVGNPTWPGWDIARGVAVLPGGRGVVVDGYGGVHGFTFDDGSGRPVAHGTPYWSGWDIVRGVAVLPDGTGGYVLDGYGGIHPFSIGSGPTPPAVTGTPYWGLDVARGIALEPDGRGGYVVDEWGGIHRFGGAPKPNAGGPSWPGQDVVRGIVLSPDGSGGWVLDYSGGLHPFGTGGDAAPRPSADRWAAPYSGRAGRSPAREPRRCRSVPRWRPDATSC